MSTVISIEDVSKLYRLGEIGTGSLAHDVNRWWHKVRGNEDPYLKVGQSNDRSTKGDSDYVYAIKDVSFEVKQGEVLGIIGRNGAGKSTLLKILSRVTTPTSGQIKVKGRIASLLEVGTGFHPELTGRENIYLNGAILGMRKTEIQAKFDEIVDFSGCDRYVDTPVKRYSSGMYVRLAFAVAAHLEPEVLIVDEVLAVGDAEFQKKCIGKMKDVAVQGRTVLFVSHNIGAVASLCNTAIILANGKLIRSGRSSEVIDSYLKDSDSKVGEGVVAYSIDESKEAQIVGVRILNEAGDVVSSIGHNQPWIVEVKYLQRLPVKGMVLGIRLTDQQDVRIETIQVPIPENNQVELGNSRRIAVRIEGDQIRPRLISLVLALHVPGVALVDEKGTDSILEICDVGGEFSLYGNNGGIVLLRHNVRIDPC